MVEIAEKFIHILVNKMPKTVTKAKKMVHNIDM